MKDEERIRPERAGSGQGNSRTGGYGGESRPQQPGRRRIGSLVASESEVSEEDDMTKRRRSRKAKRRPVGETGQDGKRSSASDETEDSQSWREKLMQRRKHRIRMVLWTLGGLAAVAYIATAVYFGSHFYEDTIIYGIDVSQLTLAEVKAEVADRLDDYRLELQEREGRTETLTAEQIGLEFVDNGSIDRVLQAQRSYIWPVMILMDSEPSVAIAFSYDSEKASAMLDTFDCMNPLLATAPQDAYIETADTGFEVAAEVMGTTLDRTRTQEVVLDALNRGLTSVSLEEEGCYIDPQVYQDDEQLNRDAASMNELACASITYDFGDRQEVVNAPVIQDWIVKTADGSFVIDDMKVTEYVEELAARYDTFGLTREFYTSLGTTVTLTGGDYGWCMDQEATVVDLLNALAEGYEGTMEPEYIYTAMSRDTNDIGYTYVEICISQQRMWCYENGTCIVDTPVVTGNPNKGNGTPAGGVWAIDAKKRDAILTGEGYTAPVDYWMPFNGDIGIHDLTSRAYFGGTIYLSNGSHGCVNTPYDQVQLIYDAVSVGTPVIVYD